MKKVVLTALLACALGVAGTASAYQHTLSLDFAQGSATVKGGDIKDPKGVNIKYRYEMDPTWGGLASLTYEKSNTNLWNAAKAKVEYASFTFGPSYRFNELLSAYGLVGLSHADATAKLNGQSYAGFGTDFAYGLGLQFNPTPQFAVDLSYERSKPGDLSNSIWMLGVGYRF